MTSRNMNKHVHTKVLPVQAHAPTVPTTALHVKDQARSPVVTS